MAELRAIALFYRCVGRAAVEMGDSEVVKLNLAKRARRIAGRADPGIRGRVTAAIATKGLHEAIIIPGRAALLRQRQRLGGQEDVAVKRTASGATLKRMGARKRRCSGVELPRLEVTAARSFRIAEGAGRDVLRECR